jgi:hypothetical protein
MMEIRKCKNKKCQRPLPEEYKHKHCENCRNEQVKQIKDSAKAIVGVVVLVGGPALAAVTKGKFKPKV